MSKDTRVKPNIDSRDWKARKPSTFLCHTKRNFYDLSQVRCLSHQTRFISFCPSGINLSTGTWHNHKKCSLSTTYPVSRNPPPPVMNGRATQRPQGLMVSAEILYTPAHVGLNDSPSGASNLSPEKPPTRSETTTHESI